jgi:hypothetical protein
MSLCSPSPCDVPMSRPSCRAIVCRERECRREPHFWLTECRAVRTPVASHALARWWPAHPSAESRLGQRPAIPHAAAPTSRARLRCALNMVAQRFDLDVRECPAGRGRVAWWTADHRRQGPDVGVAQRRRGETLGLASNAW